ADIEAWLRRRLATVADHPHEHLLRQFALWHHLARVRADAARRPLRATAKQYVTHQFTQALVFLTWLHERGIAPREVTQAHIDTWYGEHRVHQRHNVRGFLIWATEHGHLPRHLIAPQMTYQPAASFTQQRRLALLRRYLTDNSAPVTSRAAACLLLLYAQPLSRIIQPDHRRPHHPRRRPAVAPRRPTQPSTHTIRRPAQRAHRGLGPVRHVAVVSRPIPRPAHRLRHATPPAAQARLPADRGPRLRTSATRTPSTGAGHRRRPRLPPDHDGAAGRARRRHLEQLRRAHTPTTVTLTRPVRRNSARQVRA